MRLKSSSQEGNLESVASQKPREESVSNKRKWLTVLNTSKVNTKTQLLDLTVWELMVILVSSFSGMVVVEKIERKRLKKLNNAPENV